MGKVINIHDKKEVVDTPKKEFKDFIFGDFKLECGSCGNIDVLMEGIEGLRIELPATNSHELVSVCSKCKNKIRLFYDEAKDIESLIKEREISKAVKDTDVLDEEIKKMLEEIEDDKEEFEEGKEEEDIQS